MAAPKKKLKPQETQASLQAILDCTNDLIWAVDPVDFKLLAWNRRLEEYFLKYKGIQLTVGMEQQQRFPQEKDRPVMLKLQELYRQAIDHAPVTVEYKTIYDDRILELTLNRIEVEGELFGISVFGRDITERKRVETALRESEERFRRLFNGVADEIYVHDRQGRIVDVNQVACESTGHTREELLRLSVPDIDAGAKPANLDAIWERVHAGQIATVESVRRRRDGSTFPVEVHVASLSAGEQPLFIAASRDITERKQAEEALRLSERRFGEIFQESPLPYTLSELETGRFLAVNQAFLRMVRATAPEQVVGRLSYEIPLILAEDRVRLREAVRAQGRVDGLVLELQRLDGTTLTAELYVNCLEREGQRLLFICPVDITERLRAEAERRESEARFRAVVEHSHDAIVFVDANGVSLYRNPAVARLTGYGDEERLGQVVFGMFHPDDLARVRCAWAEILQEPGASRRLSYRTRHKNGGWLWFEGVVQNLLGSPGVRAIVFTVRDITERRRAEDALQVSELKYRRLYESITDAIATVDFAGHLLEVNPAFETMVGYSAAELQGLTYDDLTPPQWHAMEARIVREQVLVEGYSEVYEKEYRRRDGTIIPVELHAFLLRDDSGQPTGMWALIRDITERKRAEQGLRESEDRFRRLFQGAPDAVFVYDLHGRIVDVNDVAAHWTGYSREELRRMALSDIEVALPAAEMVPLRERVLAGQTATVEGVHRRRDGSTYPVEVHVAVYESGERPLLFAAARDITERKRLEDQLRQSQKMEAIGQLAGGVAHDFNNLLTVINGYSRLALAGLKEGDTLQHQLQEILKAGDRAAELTRQLLAFSRKQILQPKVLDLNRVVEELESLLCRLLGEDVSFCLALSPDRPTVYADPHQLEQVLMNLVVNAREAMPKGGKLLIESSVVERDESYAALHPEVKPGRYAMLAVSDTGAGMDEAIRQRIFEPFFTTKEPGRGTGLGLSMVQGIIAQSGGHINVYSEVGQGTCFKICLPLFTDKPVRAETTAVAPVARGSETILVVEDQPDVRNFTVTALREHGYVVLSAANAEEACRICEREGAGIHLVLTDVVMPDRNGRDLMVQLTKLYPAIKALYMSGYTDNVMVHHGVLDQGTLFITKPFTPEKLYAKVRAALYPASGKDQSQDGNR